MSESLSVAKTLAGTKGQEPANEIEILGVELTSGLSEAVVGDLRMYSVLVLGACVDARGHQPSPRQLPSRAIPVFPTPAGLVGLSELRPNPNDAPEIVSAERISRPPKLTVPRGRFEAQLPISGFLVFTSGNLL